MQIKNKIPVFKNVKEEAEFWDMHDFTEFLDEFKEVHMKYQPKAPKTEAVVIRIQAKIKRKMEEMAEKQGLALSTMIRSWFVEKMRTVEGIWGLEKERKI